MIDNDNDKTNDRPVPRRPRVRSPMSRQLHPALTIYMHVVL